MNQDKTALQYTKETVVKYLRGYIYNSENYARFLEDKKITVEDVKKCKVYDGTPDVLTDFPMIVISGANGNIQSLGLSDFKQEQYNEFGDIIGYLYGGCYELSLTLECATLSSYQSEFFQDFLIHALRIYLYRPLERAGILIKQVAYNGENTVNDKNNIIWVSNISLQVWTQWSEYIDLLDLKEVNLEFDVTNEDMFKE